jgi:hypothetical protein
LNDDVISTLNARIQVLEADVSSIARNRTDTLASVETHFSDEKTALERRLIDAKKASDEQAASLAAQKEQETSALQDKVATLNVEISRLTNDVVAKLNEKVVALEADRAFVTKQSSENISSLSAQFNAERAQLEEKLKHIFANGGGAARAARAAREPHNPAKVLVDLAQKVKASKNKLREGKRGAAPMGILYSWLKDRFLSEKGKLGADSRIPARYDIQTKKRIVRRDLSTAEVCSKHVIKPDTAAAKSSYVDWLASGKAGAVANCLTSKLPSTGKSTMFVSHAWSHDFRDFISAIVAWVEETRSAEEIAEGVYLWIDIFCVNQHSEPENPLSHYYREAYFKDIISKIGHTVVVLDQLLLACVPLARSWCIWELYCSTCDPSVKVDLALTPEAKEDVAKAADDPILTKELFENIALIRSKDALATLKSDKAQIDSLIAGSDGGHEKVMTIVTREILGAIFVMFSSLCGADMNEPRNQLIEQSIAMALCAGVSYEKTLRDRDPLTWALARNRGSLATSIEAFGATVLNVSHLSLCGTNPINRPIGSLPPTVLRLTSLLHLDLSKNNISDLPSGMVELDLLESLDISFNAFACLPPVVFALGSSLTILNASNNQIVSLISPAEQGSVSQLISQLVSIETIDLRANEGLALRPDVFRRLPRLTNFLFDDKRSRALEIILARFDSQRTLGEASEKDLVETSLAGGDILYSINAVTTSGASNVKSVKGVVANLRLGKAFITQKAFHTYYWEGRRTNRELGAPISDSYSGNDGSTSQDFERGRMIWTQAFGVYHEITSKAESL